MSETISKSRHTKLPHFKSMSDEDLAVVSKLVKPSDAPAGNRQNRSLNMPDASVLGRVAGRTATNNNDAKNLFQVHPDMDLARSILVSGILAPTDLVSVNLLYGLESNDLDDNLTGPMLRIIRDYFDNTYKIKKLLPEMLSDALFMKGAYPLLVMPETSIDFSINSSSKVTFESLGGEVDKNGWYRPYGALGIPEANGAYKASFESMWDYNIPSLESIEKERFSVFKGFANKQGEKEELPGKVYVTDNPTILSNPKLLEKLRKQRQGEIYGRRQKRHGQPPAGTTTGMENNVKVDTKMTLNQAEKLFYVNRPSNAEPMQSILTPKQLSSRNRSNPLVMHLPSEAVIPIHVPGNPRQHIGYFILLDIAGNPLSIDFRDDYYTDIKNAMNTDAGTSSHLLNVARRNMSGSTAWGNDEVDHLQRAYSQAVETDLLNRLRSGAVTGEYELSKSEEVFRLMFARSLAAKNTMLLYVPAELMTYIAFDYNEDGVGKSLLEDGKILGSLRSTLLFASTMGAVLNSIDGKNIKITLPEEDENPAETVAFQLGEYAKVNRAGFPVGVTNPTELINHLQNAGTVVTVTGNSAFPELEFDVQSREGIHKTMDKELDEELRRRHIQTFGLTPETMEASTGADFAATVINQHLMLLKRVIQYQDEFTPFLTDFVRRYTVNSGPLFDELLEVVKANVKYLPKDLKEAPEEFVDQFINLLNIDLPKPETNRLKDQMEGYQAYTDAITTAIDAYLKTEAFDAIQSQGLQDHMDAIKASLISMLQRKYLREKNILPELDIFNTIKEEDGPVFNLLDETQEHLEGVMLSIESYVKKMIAEGKKRQKRLEKQNAETEELANGGSGVDGVDDFGSDDNGLGVDDESGNSDFDGGGDGGGLDDFDGLDSGDDDLSSPTGDDDTLPESTEETPESFDTPVPDLEPETELEPTGVEAESDDEELDLEIPNEPGSENNDVEPEQEVEEEEIDLEIPETPTADEEAEPEVPADAEAEKDDKSKDKDKK